MGDSPIGRFCGRYNVFQTNRNTVQQLDLVDLCGKLLRSPFISNMMHVCVMCDRYTRSCALVGFTATGGGGAQKFVVSLFFCTPPPPKGGMARKKKVPPPCVKIFCNPGFFLKNATLTTSLKLMGGVSYMV